MGGGGGSGEVKGSHIATDPDSVPLATWSQVAAFRGRRAQGSAPGGGVTRGA